jgi:hypothetical protein
MPTFDEFKLAFNHTETLLDRRKSLTSFYLSVNTGVITVIGVLLKDANLPQLWLSGSILVLLCAGVSACWIWRSLLHQYEILLDWWYARLREMEAALPDSARLVTQEYQDLYVAAKDRKPTQRIGMTEREVALTWVFTSLYVIFAAGIISLTLA